MHQLLLQKPHIFSSLLHLNLIFVIAFTTFYELIELLDDFGNLRAKHFCLDVVSLGLLTTCFIAIDLRLLHLIEDVSDLDKVVRIDAN